MRLFPSIAARVVGSLVLLLVSMVTPALASPDRSYGTALALYTAGHYDECVHMGREIGSAEARALGARALLSKAVSEVPFSQRLPVLNEAKAEAEAAIALNAGVVEGHLQKLVAYGHISRLPGFSGGTIAVAEATRDMVLRALALEPDNPWALASFGGWNLEVVRRAPMGVGALFFGASRADGLAAYRRALGLAPANIVIRYEFALALLSFKMEADRTEAQAILRDTVALPTDDTYSRFLQKRAGRLLTLTAAKDERLGRFLAAYRGEIPDIE